MKKQYLYAVCFPDTDYPCSYNIFRESIISSWQAYVGNEFSNTEFCRRIGEWSKRGYAVKKFGITMIERINK